MPPVLAMEGHVTIEQVVCVALAVEGLMLLMLMVFVALTWSGLQSVRGRMVTQEGLAAAKSEISSTLQAQLNTSATATTKQMAELSAECQRVFSAVAGAQATQASLTRETELMSHNMARIFETVLKSLVEKTVPAPAAPPPAQIPS